jgi:hypothetical protein
MERLATALSVGFLLALATPHEARAACCEATRMTVTSSTGTAQLATLAAFPLPAGALLTIDGATADTACRHDAIVPVDGFTAPTFCLPALGFTGRMWAMGCESATAAGKGSLWDGNATCSDADVEQDGDTVDGVCDNHLPPCTNKSPNAAGGLTVKRGNGTCDPPGLNAEIDIPAAIQVWSDVDGNCPDDDGTYDPGTDTLVTDVKALLSFTTATSTARFADSNADSCFREGIGPSGPVTLSGAPAPGPCCSVGQPIKLVGTSVVFSDSAPLYDMLFQVSMPANVTACDAWPGPGTCTIPECTPAPPPTTSTTTVTMSSTTMYTGPTVPPSYPPIAGGREHPEDHIKGNAIVRFIPNTPVSWDLKIPPWPFRAIPIILFVVGLPVAAFARGASAGLARLLGVVMCLAAAAMLVLFPG